MSFDSRALPSEAPDRVFTRTMCLVLGAWLALALGAAMATDRIGQRAGRAAELAMVAAAQASAADDAAKALERVAAAPEGPEDRSARIALGWEVERLAALEASRVGLAEARDAAPSELAAAIADASARARDGLPAAEARALGHLFANRLAPQAERQARALEAAAARARAHARLAALLILGLKLAAALALACGLARRARGRIADWVRASREAEAEHRFRLLHDPLTQLPNATFLRAHLERLAAAAERAPRQTAVIRLDLERFKLLRDTLGQRAADEILRIAARRIRQTLRAGDFAAHLGLDDFVLVAGELEDANHAAGIAHRLQQALTKPFSLQGGARRINCSIGVTLLADDLPEPGRVLANAEIALAEAQAAGPGAVRYFRESMRVEAERRETLLAELLAGLERGEIAPHFQPQLDLATGRFTGFEALVRWSHPTQGLLTPVGFLDFAEAADLTERIGETVLSQTLAALTAWDAAGLDVPTVGVNFAMAQLRDPRLVEKIKWEVERHDLDPSRIAIEVLETVLIKSDEDLVVRNLRGLASAGFRIELDDFGTGHASIQNLRRFMVDRIKIDRSFVAGIEASEEQQALTAAMIAMAHALGIRTIAEGVETPEAEAALRRLGCDHFQGYLISRPMSQAETYGWLRAGRPRESGAEPPARPQRGDPNMP